MSSWLIVCGAVGLFACVLGLLLMAVMLVRERQYWWAAGAMFCMAVLIFLGLVGDLISQGWWK